MFKKNSGLPRVKSRGFTLMELLIIIALIAIVATAFIIFLDPMRQINKARDAKRKSGLDTLKKTFEDFYNDKSCYPKLSEVCYNAQAQYAPNEAKSCNICGNDASSPLFSPYLEKLPCDPESPKKEFLYQVDDMNCPQWFRVYSELNIKNDQVINDLGCSAEACGPKPFFGYDFGVASPNTELEKSNTISCFSNDDKCNNCGTYQVCLNRVNCQKYKKFYSNYSACCEDNDLCLFEYKCTYVITGVCFQCGRSAAECNATGKCEAFTIQRGTCP